MQKARLMPSENHQIIHRVQGFPLRSKAISRYIIRYDLKKKSYDSLEKDRDPAHIATVPYCLAHSTLAVDQQSCIFW